MTEQDSVKEQRIMQMMRKTLTGIVRETTPRPGMQHVLSDHSLQNIRDCLALVSARERELSTQNGHPSALRPRFTDEPGNSKVVPFITTGRAPDPDPSS